MNAGEFSRKRALIQRRAGSRAAFARKATMKLAREARAEPVIQGGRMVGWRMPDGSVACEKIRYREQDDTLVELARIARDCERGYVPVRAYRCPMCAGWHLTSKA